MNGTSKPVKEKREAIHYATGRGLSQRRACLLVEINRSTARYASHGPDDAELIQKIQAIQSMLPRFGVRRVHDRLKRTGQALNHKRVQRVMRENGLAVKRTRRKKTIRTGASVPCQAAYPNHVWTPIMSGPLTSRKTLCCVGAKCASSTSWTSSPASGWRYGSAAVPRQRQ